MNVSIFYGKKIESTAGKKGYVISVNATAGRLECLGCADEDENEFIVDVKNIISYGDTILFDDRESAIKAAKPIRLGCAGFDEKGNFLGTLQEYTFSKNRLLKAKIGKKKYPSDGIVCGDIVIVKGAKKLKHDVIKDGKVLIKKGTPLTGEVLKTAEDSGEYVQTNLKSI